MKYSVLLVAVSLFLASCGKESTGVGSESSSSTGSNSSSIISKIKTFTADKSKEITIKMPALALINDAFLSKYDYKMAQSMRHLDRTNTLYGEKPAKYDDFLAKFLINAYKSDAETRSDLVKVWNSDAVKALESGDEEGFKKHIFRHSSALRLLACNQPLSGWEVDSRNNKDLRNYVLAISSECDFTNLIYTELAAKLSNDVLENPQKAKEMILKEWESIPIETLHSVWDDVIKSNENSSFNADFSGVKGVQFVGQGGRYENEGGGFIIKKNGMIWFGQGAISGRNIEISLRSMIGAKMEKSKAIANETSTDSGNKTGSNVGVK